MRGTCGRLRALLKPCCGAVAQAQADEAADAAAERWGSLSHAYGELKHAWETRGPREQDVAKMQHLEGLVSERDAQLATVEQRFHALRNVCSPHVTVVSALVLAAASSVHCGRCDRAGCGRHVSAGVQEMLLREDNYNNRFANGGAGKQVLAVGRASSSAQEMAEWMLKKKGPASSSFKRTASDVAGKGRPTRSGSAFGADAAA